MTEGTVSEKFRRTGVFALAVMLALMVLAIQATGDARAQEEAPEGGTRKEVPLFKPRPDGEAVPGQIIVKFREDTASAVQARVRRVEGIEKVRDLDLIDAEVDKVSGQPVEQAIRVLERRPDVEYAEPNYVVYPTGYADEPRFDELWGLHNSGQAIEGSTGTPNVDVNGIQASAKTLGDPNLVVAVIDDGVDFSHPDLAGRQWKNPGEISGNGIDDDGNGKVDDINGWDVCHQDNTVHDPGDDSHGTHVSGTIAASVNGQGIVGVAPNVKIMALKFLSDTGTGAGCNSTAGAIQAIQYAKSEGAKISNNSWGGGGFSQALKDAIDTSGSLFLAAAGNGGSDGVGDNNDASSFYPASYDSANILSVAAVNNRGSLGGFSNYGAATVDISAPGVSILSAVPGNPGSPAAALSSVGSSGKAVTAGFGAEEMGTSAKRASFMAKSFQAVGRGSQQVVLVDDDGSHDGEFVNVGPTIAAAIQSATGSAPQTIQVGEGNGPPLSQLSGKTVVWATGDSFYSGFDENINFIWNLTPADMTTLTNFLGGGGKLILTGRDLLYENETSAFVTSTLDLTVEADTYARTFTGASGTAFAGESYAFDGLLADPFGVSYDRIVPSGATAATQGGYDATPATWESWPGTSMATPHVTGVAALAASVNPGLLNKPLTLKNLVMNTGKPLPATAGKTVTGDMADAKAAVDAATPDTTPPNTAITSGPSGITKATSASFGFSSSESGSKFQCSLDGAPFASCASPKTYTVTDGSHAFRVRATDAAGNVDATPATRSWTVDTVKPAFSGMSPRPEAGITDRTPAIKVTVRDNLTNLQKSAIKLYVNGALISASKYSYSASTDQLVYNSPTLSTGKKTVKVVATDAARNVGNESWYFTIR